MPVLTWKQKQQEKQRIKNTVEEQLEDLVTTEDLAELTGIVTRLELKFAKYLSKETTQ